MAVVEAGMGLEIKPLAKGFGAEVRGVDLTCVDEGLAEAIMDVLVEHALALFRRQSLHDDDIYRLCSAFGPVEEPAAKRSHSPQYKEINYIANLRDSDGVLIGGLTKEDEGEGVWHSDQAFRRSPATISTLFCIHAPAEGGGTSFISTTLGYAALPGSLARRAQGLRGKYLPGRMHEIEKVEVTHPCVLVNPRTGRHALYVSPNTRGFEGVDDDEGERLKKELLSYQMREAHRHTDQWRMGDMLIYDNAQLLHRRERFRGLRWLKATRTFAPCDRFAVPD